MGQAGTSKVTAQIMSGKVHRNSVEEMGLAVKDFFDLEAQQLETGEFRCPIEFITAGGALLYREHYPLRTHVRGEVLQNRFGFAIPEEGPSLRFDGQEMDQCRLASAMTGEEMDVYAGGGLKQFVVLLDRARLLGLAAESGLPAAAQQAIEPGRAVMPLIAKPQAVAALRSRIQHLLRAATAGELQAGPDAFEDWIYAEALSIIDVSDAPLGRPPAAALVRRAIDIVEDQQGVLRVAELCRLLKVSPGTLQNAFRSFTGLTPNEFFRMRQLNRARRMLLEADPGDAKVTTIATQLGFTELGRFSVRYRRLFGELPSETLRRRMGATVAVGW